jgi:hypothetical protein
MMMSAIAHVSLLIRDRVLHGLLSLHGLTLDLTVQLYHLIIPVQLYLSYPGVC